MGLVKGNLELFDDREVKEGKSDSIKLKGRNASKQDRVVLTERDFEILRFILEMKFASRAEVFQKFFKVKKSDELSTSDAWTQKRLRQLEKAGFLRGKYSFSESTKYFIVTYRAYYAIRNLSADLALCKPVNGFDNRTFNHDKLLLQTRLELEAKAESSSWISDRMLRAGLDRAYGFNASFVPDAIYTNIEGSKVALEIEIATKAKSRYREKIQSYVNLSRKKHATEHSLSRVRFVCYRDQPFEILKKETRIFGDLFSVEKAMPYPNRGGVL